MKKCLLLFVALILINLSAIGIGCKPKTPEKPAEKTTERPSKTPTPQPVPTVKPFPAPTVKPTPMPKETRLNREEINRKSPFGFHPAHIREPDFSLYGDAQYIGIKWHRPSMHMYWFLAQPDLNAQKYDFSFYDKYYGDVPQEISIMVTIAPEAYRDEGRSKLGSYLPIDEEKYKAFVKAAVARYDGDGIDDMPDLKNPIRYWQVGNEPTALIKKNFSGLQHITYSVIKETCPNCKVIIGGASQPILQRGGEFETKPDLYFKWFVENYEPILKELNGRGFDIFDFHWYGKADGDYKKIKPVYEGIKEILKKYNFSEVEIWVTEAGSYSGAPAPSGPLGSFPFQSEKEQAADYFKRFVFSLSMGIKKLFPAFGLIEGFMNDDGYFDHTGLIYDGRGSGDLGRGVKKLSYFTYKKMTEVLEGSNWGSTETVQEKEDIYIYKFNKSGKPIWAAWNDQKEPKTVRLTINNSIKDIKIVEVVPKYEFGKDVVNFITAFNEVTWTWVDKNKRNIEFVLRDIPVLLFEK